MYLKLKKIFTKFFIQSGVTYIELLIYVAIVVMLIATLIPFLLQAIEGGVKSSTQQEVISQAQYISERIKYEIRNASGINSVTANQISLATATPATNPTVISLTSGNIVLTQGAGSPLTLNSKNTTVSSLTFTNYTSADTKTKDIQFVFTINANFQGAGTRQEYNASTTMEGSAEVRTN